MSDRDSSNVLVFLGLSVAGYVVYEKFIKPYIVIPVPAAPYIKRMLIVVDNVKLKSNILTFDLAINNPNTQPMSIKSVVGLAYVNEQPVGEVAHYGDNVIQPNSKSVFNMAVKLRAVPVVNLFLSALQGKLKHQVMQFKGVVNINNTPVKISEQYKIS